MGTRDLPVMIDYVLSYTKQQTLHYIGHSMGTTTLFILLSMKPEYNAKIELGICLAPIAIWKERIPLPENIFNKIPKIVVRIRHQSYFKKKKNIFYIFFCINITFLISLIILIGK